MSSIYYGGRRHGYAGVYVDTRFKSEEQLEAELKNMLEHGVTDPIVFHWAPENLGEFLDIRNRAGMTNDTLYMLGARSAIRGDSPEEVKKEVEGIIDYVRPYGINQVYFYGIDEARGERLVSQRPAWKATREAGGKVFVAGYKGSNFPLMGDIQDVLICAGRPSREEAAKWHSEGHKIWMYGYPQGGVANPEVYRRNYGLYVWKSNYDGVATFAYHWGYNNIWNDVDHPTRRDHNFTYPTIDGVIDTISWEGYREGIDDIRYATTLKLAIEDAKNSRDANIRRKASEAEQWLAEVDVITGNLDEIRTEMISWILAVKGKR